MQQQRGMSLFTVLFFLLFVGAAAVLAMKVVPVYSEYAQIKQELNTLSTQTSVGEASLRKSFDDRATVAGIVSIHGDKLTVVAGNDANYLRASYQREVPLFGNVSLLFNFDTQAGPAPAQQ
ncbi:DUF4845 domain-containing protein [Xenophilus sp. AP218F]|nr:DUF4845 domain-containing protein [Chromobacterium sp. ASV5]OWY40621.1 DUF4845 domain-containing protein [Xenophilus sp. AP218F]